MTAPLSVGLFTYSTLPRGSVVHTACVADALQDAGCQVTVYALDKEQRADIDMIRDAAGASRLELDEIQSYRHNPTTYVELLGNGLYTPYVLQYAPIGERYRHIINRLGKVPELIRQAEANLEDSPEIWNRGA